MHAPGKTIVLTPPLVASRHAPWNEVATVAPFTGACARAFAAIALTVLLAWSASAQGADLTWNGGGMDSQWSTAANWGGTMPNAGDALFFGGTTRLTPSNDLAADTSFAGLTFNSNAGAFILGGNRITLGGNVTNNATARQTISLDMLLDNTRTFDTAAGNLTLSGNLTGPGGLVKTGGQTLTLSGSANTYSGLTTVNGGTLELRTSTGDAIGGDLSISGGAKVVFGGSHKIADTANVTMSGAGSVFNGTGVNAGYPGNLQETIGSLTITGGIFNSGPASSNWTVTNAASFTGGAGNTIFVGNSGAVLSFGSLSLTAMNGSTSLNNNNFTLFGNGTTVRSTITVGNGGLSLDGSALNLRRGTSAGTLGSRLILNGDVTTTGSTASSIREESGGTVGAIGIELSSTADPVNRTFNVGSGADLTVNVPITNGAASVARITKTGAGKLSFTGGQENTYTGTTTINEGTLSLGKTAGTTAVAGDILINAGGTLAWTAANQIADSAGITVDGGSISSWSNDETIAFYTQKAGGAPSSGNTGHITVTGAFALEGGNTLTINSSANPAWWNVGSATLTGAGILIGANNGAGLARTAFNIGTGGLTMKGQKITVNRGSSGAELVLDGDFTGSANNSIVVGDVGAVEPRLVLGNAIRTFQIIDTTTVGIAMEGEGGGLTKTGWGKLVLSGNNTYTGLTTISSGVLKITTATALGSTDGATLIGSSAQLEVAGGLTIDEPFLATGGVGPGDNGGHGLILSSSGNNVFTRDIDLNVGSGTRINVAAGSTLTFQGAVSTPDAFRKLGGGTLVFTHETAGLTRDAYIGHTVLGPGGMVLMGHDRGFGTGAIQFDNAGGIGSSSLQTRSLTNAIGINTTGTVTLGTATTGNLTVSGNVTLNADATVAVANETSTLSGIIFGASRSLTKTGSGTLVLSGANTYSGTTTVEQGTLLVNGSHTGAGAYEVHSGATLGGSQDLDEAIETSGLTILAGGFLAPGSSIGTLHIDGSVTIGETAGLATWLVEYDGTGAGAIDLLTVSGALDIANAAIEFEPLGAELDGLSPYVFATYGSLIGTEFSSIVDLPSGYRIDYAYAGNQLALVSLAVPEPSSVVGLTLLALLGLALPRCRRCWAA